MIAFGLLVTRSYADTPVDPSPPISIDIEPSRSQLIAGEGLGVIAKVKNVSPTLAISIGEWDMRLVLPLELEGARGAVRGRPGFFPTGFHDTHVTNDAEYFNNFVTLKPGDTYNVFWTESPSSASWIAYIGKQISIQLQFLFFTPGQYDITVITKYWVNEGLPGEDYRTVTKSVLLPVSAPQFVILFGAAIGGLIAYFIFPKAGRHIKRSERLSLRLIRQIAGVFGAMLMSVIVTILLSRISETQFVIKVTVNDFWGAIVIGFVANYGGSKILDMIILRNRAKDGRPAEGEKLGRGEKS